MTRCGEVAEWRGAVKPVAGDTVDGSGGGVSPQAAVSSHVAFIGSSWNREVPVFTGTTGRPGDHFAVSDDAATNPGAYRYVDEVFGSDVVSKACLCKGRQRSFVSNPAR